MGREARKTSAMDKGIRENYLRIGGRAGTGAALERGLKGMGWVGSSVAPECLGRDPWEPGENGGGSCGDTAQLGQGRRLYLLSGLFLVLGRNRLLDF